MPVFFRPVYFHRAVPYVYKSVSNAHLYNGLQVALEYTEVRDSPATRKSRVHFKTIKKLQGDYARYAKKLAKYAIERKLSFRPVENRLMDHRIAELPEALKNPTTIQETEAVISSLEKQLNYLEEKMAALQKWHTDPETHPTFKIFSEVATSGKLEGSLKEFLSKHEGKANDGASNYQWVAEDLETLYGLLRSWIWNYDRRTQLVQLAMCLTESSSHLSSRRTPAASLHSVEYESQIGFTTEALESMFDKARAL